MSNYFHNVDALFTNDETRYRIPFEAFNMHVADPETFRRVAILSQFYKDALSLSYRVVTNSSLNQFSMEVFDTAVKKCMCEWYPLAVYRIMGLLVDIIPQAPLPATSGEWMEIVHILGDENEFFEIVDMVDWLFFEPSPETL